MRFLSSIRARLTTLTVTALAATALVALGGALFARWTHASDTRLTAEVAASFHRSSLFPRY